MAVDFVELGTAPREIEAAVLLRDARNVHVRAAPSAVEGLVAAGFVESPAMINSWLRLPYDLGRRSRNLRRSVADARARWLELDLEVTLHDVRGFGQDRVVEQIYFPLFVPHFYSRGLSPWGAHQLAAFLEITPPDALIVTVERGGRLIGAALLHERSAAGPLHLVRGEPPAARWIEGLVYVLGPPAQGCQRALLSLLPEIFAAEGYTWLSFGRDLPFAERRISAVVLEKLRWADSVAAHFEQVHDCYSIRPETLQAGQGLLLIAGARGGPLRTLVYGAAPPAFALIAAELAPGSHADGGR